MEQLLLNYIMIIGYITAILGYTLLLLVILFIFVTIIVAAYKAFMDGYKGL